jgi:hypothetical protein
MARPTSAQGWADFYSEQAAKRAAVEAQQEKQAAKAQRPAHEHHLPHPLVSRPTFPPGTPVEVQMRFIDAHLHYRGQASKAVQAHREAQAAEAERMTQPHPMTQAPLVHIPIPERGKK